MKLVDISHTIDENTPPYPGDEAFLLKKVTSLGEDSYTSYKMSSTLHTGTHIDMPMHLIDDHRTAADFDISSFMGKGVLLNVKGQSEIGMAKQYEKIVTPRSVVLLYTGFDKYFGEEKYFTQHPVVSSQLADFLISRGVKILGMDMPSPDYGPFPIHKALLSNDIFILENLTNLHSLVGVEDFDVMAFPLKISAEASFVRAVCNIK